MELPYINAVAHPEIYPLEPNSNCSGYTFTTDDGVRYQVVFIRDYTLEGFDLYQLAITVENGEAGRRDARIEKTVDVILEMFFESNQNGLLYICDNKDGRQAARNRLFLSWFRRFEKNELYTLADESLVVDDVPYFISLLLRNDNPQREELLATFLSFCHMLRDKWRS